MPAGAPTPVLRIFDEAKARQFYVDYLGFAVDFEHRFAPDAPIYLGVSLGACKLHLSEHHGDGAPGARLRVPIDELEAYHAALVAKRYKYYRPGLQDQEWGTREMAVEDGFGNKLVFYRTLP
jgi:catechol 2,3-dioxygenase-like lactoylglutathione lyase family enzyme